MMKTQLMTLQRVEAHEDEDDDVEERMHGEEEDDEVEERMHDEDEDDEKKDEAMTTKTKMMT